MKSIALVFLFALLAASASAQTPHPCDVPPPVNPSIPHASVIVSLCHSLKDMDGKAIAVTAFEFNVDGTVTTWANPAPIGAANSQGLWYFEAPSIAVGAGMHSVVVTTVSGSRRSSNPAYLFSSTLPPATLVIGIRVK